MNTQPVFVPVLYWGREKYVCNAEVAGVFKSQADARVALLNLLRENYFISYPMDEEEPLEGDRPILPEAEFWSHLKKMAESSLDELKTVCHEYGDSYFEAGWDFTIVERVIE